MKTHNPWYFLLLSSLIFSHTVYAKNLPEPTHFLTISDIHFDPFYTCDPKAANCPVIDLLEQKPISEWDAIFTRYDQLPAEYDKDTGYVLFKSSLSKFKAITKSHKIGFVILGGDYIVHDLKELYFKYRPHANDENFEKFAAKLFSYVSLALKKSIAPVDAYMAVGNNDTFDEHYTSTASFYQTMGPVWASLIHDEKQQAMMKRTFLKNGYYAIDAAKNLKLVVLNSTFFSPKCSTNYGTEAKEQLIWLRETLQTAATNQQKVMIVAHIPAGVDVYDTLHKKQISLLWREEYITEFYAIIEEFNHSITALLTGHLHADWMQSQKLGKSKLFMTSIPSISPQFGNNPGYKLYKFNQQTFQLDDYKVYYYPINNKVPRWMLEYRFKDVYPVKMSDGPDLVERTGIYAEAFKKFFALGQNAQPITDGKWHPYYWCSLHHAFPKNYINCLQEENKTPI